MRSFLETEDVCLAAAAKLALIVDLVSLVKTTNDEAYTLSAKGIDGLYWLLSEIEQDITRSFSTVTPSEQSGEKEKD